MISDSLRNLIYAIVVNQPLRDKLVDAVKEELDVESEASYQGGYTDGYRKGKEDGYEEGRMDVIRQTTENVMGFNGLSGYDRERLLRIVRTGSPY